MKYTYGQLDLKIGWNQSVRITEKVGAKRGLDGQVKLYFRTTGLTFATILRGGGMFLHLYSSAYGACNTVAKFVRSYTGVNVRCEGNQYTVKLVGCEIKTNAATLVVDVYGRLSDGARWGFGYSLPSQRLETPKNKECALLASVGSDDNEPIRGIN